jgi:hypothetical protein
MGSPRGQERRMEQVGVNRMSMGKGIVSEANARGKATG